MTFTVKQTEIDSLIQIAPPYQREMLQNFDLSVVQHAKDLSDYHQHLSKHLQEFGPNHGQTVSPPPDPPNLIDQAVRRNDDGTFVPDFQVIDDRPSTEQLAAKRLREKKQALITQASENESKILTKLLGGHKQLAFQFKYADILKADDVRAKAIVKASPLDSQMTSDELRAQVNAGRPIEDTKFKQEQEARLASAELIVRHRAGLHSQIDDLTEQNIDSWVMPPFPNV